MGKKNYEREYHRTRLARNYRFYRFAGERGWRFSGGLAEDWAEYHNGHGYWVTRRNGEKSFRILHSGPICGGMHNSAFYGRVIPKDMSMDDITFWEAQEINNKAAFVGRKMMTTSGSLIGNRSKKWIKKKFHVERRVRERTFLDLCMIGEYDAADNIALDIDRGAQWWEIF